MALLAPLLSNGLDLIANAVKQKGKEWLKEKTNIDLKASMSDDELLQLKQFELDQEVELLKLSVEQQALNIDLEKAYLRDTQSARSMQAAALNQEDIFAKRFILYFAIFWSILAAGFICAITFVSIPESNIRFADTILGFLLGTIVSQIMQFFYGSSKSSQSKDNVIKDFVERGSK